MLNSEFSNIYPVVLLLNCLGHIKHDKLCDFALISGFTFLRTCDVSKGVSNLFPVIIIIPRLPLKSSIVSPATKHALF